MSEVRSTVDDREVAFYTRLADTWWDPEGPFWPLHVLNALRTRWIAERLVAEPFAGDGALRADALAGLRVLDVGCGGGLLSEAMARAGAEVTGIDPTVKNIEVARLHAEGAGLAVRYRPDTVETLAAEGARFDVVLDMEVVEHVPDLAGHLAAACAVVDDGGHLFVATLNRSIAGFLIGIVGAEYVTGVLPKGTHRWDRFVRPRELAAHLDRSGLDVVARSGVRVNPLRRRMTLTPWLGVNYMVHARRR